MNLNSESYNKALAVLSKRRADALRTADERNKEIDNKIKEIAELKSTHMSILSRIVLLTKNPEEIEKLKNQSMNIAEKIKDILIKNGYSQDYLDVKYACPKCRDTGFVDYKQCDCLTKILSEVSKQSLGGKSKIDECTFDSFRLDYYPESFDDNLGVSPREKMQEIFNYCKNYAVNFSTKSANVFFAGKTGLGKTHLALSIANLITSNGYNVVYGSAQDLFRKIEKEYFSGFDSFQNNVLHCDLLIIDDLGTEFESKFNTAQVYNLINSRQNIGLPTIITSNLTLMELQTRYAERIVSRLIGDYDYLFFVGNDIRQIKKYG